MDRIPGPWIIPLILKWVCWADAIRGLNPGSQLCDWKYRSIMVSNVRQSLVSFPYTVIVASHQMVIYRKDCLRVCIWLDWHWPVWDIFGVPSTSGYRPRSNLNGNRTAPEQYSRKEGERRLSSIVSAVLVTFGGRIFSVHQRLVVRPIRSVVRRSTESEQCGVWSMFFALPDCSLRPVVVENGSK